MSSLVVLGSTGAIGRRVVREALRRPEISKVVALTRALVQPHTGENESNDSNKEELYRTLFDLPAQELPASALGKLHAVTFDWEAFMQAWSSARRAALEPPTQAPNAKEQEGEGKEEDKEDKVMRALAPYKEALWGHTYAAICLGTTRHDAGSAAQFIRCDFDYVLAFTEALLCLSAPRGLVATSTSAPASQRMGGGAAADGFCYHVNDGMKQTDTTTMKTDAQSTAAGNGAAATCSARTLRKIFYVSSYNASASSMMLYMKTKGRVEGALQERVAAHNGAEGEATKASSDDTSAAAGQAHKVQLGILRPGLLDRGDKARTIEKAARFVMSALPVEVCARCIVHECVHDTMASGDMTYYRNDDIKRLGKE